MQNGADRLPGGAWEIHSGIVQTSKLASAPDVLGSTPAGQISSSRAQQHPQILVIHTDLDVEFKSIAEPFEKVFLNCHEKLSWKYPLIVLPSIVITGKPYFYFHISCFVGLFGLGFFIFVNEPEFWKSPNFS